jgi:hypothetical protein
MIWEKMAHDNLRISILSATDGWNMCGCEATMAREEDCGERRNIGGKMAAKGRSDWVPDPIPF